VHNVISTGCYSVKEKTGWEEAGGAGGERKEKGQSVDGGRKALMGVFSENLFGWEGTGGAGAALPKKKSKKRKRAEETVIPPPELTPGGRKKEKEAKKLEKGLKKSLREYVSQQRAAAVIRSFTWPS